MAVYNRFKKNSGNEAAQPLHQSIDAYDFSLNLLKVLHDYNSRISESGYKYQLSKNTS
jgi:hypothetical protein